MSVYVDPLGEWGTNANWRWTHSCHLVADDLQELHAFAKRLGLKRAWFQGDKEVPHYDLNAGRREKAVALGAIEITHEELGWGWMTKRLLAARAKYGTDS